MIRITKAIWVGDSEDEKRAYVEEGGIGAVLNVAQDFQPTNGWAHDIEYMHVGLIDGPGNTLSAYYAAVLALSSLLTRAGVLVCCHIGGRSVAVVIMYLHATGAFGWDGYSTIMFDDFSSRTGWAERIAALNRMAGYPLPPPHEMHAQAFAQMDWRSLRKLLDD